MYAGRPPSSRPLLTNSSRSGTGPPTSRPTASARQEELEMHPDRLDGNAAAGVLAEIFVAEMTVATTTCETCGAVARVGELHTYLGAPGLVVRCAACGAAQ